MGYLRQLVLAVVVSVLLAGVLGAEEVSTAEAAPAVKESEKPVSPFQQARKIKRDIPPIKEYFPLGVCVYLHAFGECAKLQGMEMWDFTAQALDDIKAHHCNMVFVGNVVEKDLKKLVDLAEERGMRVYPQVLSIQYPRQLKKKETRRYVFNNRIRKIVERLIPKYRDRYGLLAWGMAEEIKPDIVEEFKDYQDLIAKLDPAHPGVILHNNQIALDKSCKLLKPEIIGRDSYPFDNHRSGAISIFQQEKALEEGYQSAKSCGANFWAMQAGCYTYNRYDKLGGIGNRYPTPKEMRLQSWVAILHGAKGLIYFLYVGVPEQCKSGESLRGLRTARGGETAQWKELGETFRDISFFTPLLVRLDKLDESIASSDNSNIAVETFAARKEGKERYLIVVNRNTVHAEKVKVKVKSEDRIYDLRVMQRLKAVTLEDFSKEFEVEIGPGDGNIYLIGNEQDFNNCIMEYL